MSGVARERKGEGYRKALFLLFLASLIVVLSL